MLSAGQILRMASWVRHPPPMRRILPLAAALAASLLIAGADWLGLLPDFITVDRQRVTPPKVQPLP
jgi:hypothetical protein